MAFKFPSPFSSVALCGSRRRTLRQVLEYSPQSTIPCCARRPAIFLLGGGIALADEEGAPACYKTVASTLHSREMNVTL